MAKNNLENKSVRQQIEFHFPIEGETITASTLEEAQEELERRMAKRSKTNNSEGE